MEDIISISDIMRKRELIVLPKFIARKPEKEVISMRIATDLLKILDAKAAEADISRNKLINQMIMFALANMEAPPKNQ